MSGLCKMMESSLAWSQFKRSRKKTWFAKQHFGQQSWSSSNGQTNESTSSRTTTSPAEFSLFAESLLLSTFLAGSLSVLDESFSLFVDESLLTALAKRMKWQMRNLIRIFVIFGLIRRRTRPFPLDFIQSPSLLIHWNVLKQTRETIVKFGFNDNGYNEISAITNQLESYFWSQMTVVLHKSSLL